jgi:hypothetical protein
MTRRIAQILFAVVICSTSAAGRSVAQKPWYSRIAVGKADTLGTPADCSAADGIRAIETWFDAINTGDTNRIRAAISPKLRWVSVNPFGPTQSLYVAHARSELNAYVLERAAKQEHLTLKSVDFNGWRDGELGIGPLSFERSASDLPARIGRGKAAFRCGDGLVMLSVTPEPPAT